MGYIFESHQIILKMEGFCIRKKEVLGQSLKVRSYYSERLKCDMLDKVIASEAW